MQYNTIFSFFNHHSFNNIVVTFSIDVTYTVLKDELVKLSQQAFSQNLFTEVVNSTGKGKCLKVCHVRSFGGFVSGGFLCFESKRELSRLSQWNEWGQFL